MSFSLKIYDISHFNHATCKFILRTTKKSCLLFGAFKSQHLVKASPYMRQFLIAFFLINFFTVPIAFAVDRVDLSIGSISRPTHSSPLINSFRAGISWDTDYLKFEDNYVQHSLRIELSTGLNQSETNNVHDITLAPVLHYQFYKLKWQPFLEISSGAAYISETLWAPYHDLSSNRLFADRIGIGYTIGKTEISLNFFHFSNAGLKRPNPGADMLLLRTSFKI